VIRVAASCWSNRLAVAAALLIAQAALAQTVSMSGSLGSKALLVIDGKPHSMAVGSTVDGVTLLSVSGSDALAKVKGAQVRVVLGGAQINTGSAPSEGGGNQIVLTADSRGHFISAGSINGKSVRFIVDTGATMISMGQEDAERLGLDYKAGRKLYTTTANGRVPVYAVSLGAVRVGDVNVYDVEAVVLPMPSMGTILLGNSFLTRFQMKRENDRMTLDRRF
jgi:aspartyl protease family protein